MEITAYITSDRGRVIAGAPLVLCIVEDKEREECVKTLGKALKADIIQLENGDYCLLQKRAGAGS